MSARLLGKRVIGTGGASGMGAAQVARFVAEGVRVIVADRNEALGRPGNTDTPMIADKNYPVRDVPLNRNATVEEVAARVLYLVSEESTYTTGAERVIDGGYTAY